VLVGQRAAVVRDLGRLWRRAGLGRLAEQGQVLVRRLQLGAKLVDDALNVGLDGRDLAAEPGERLGVACSSAFSSDWALSSWADGELCGEACAYAPPAASTSHAIRRARTRPAMERISRRPPRKQEAKRGS
jgi:hypothetical protein